MSWSLSVDFGTTFTSAAAVGADGSATLIELDGSARVPSVVALDDDGEIVVGLAPGDEAGWDPERVERNPKRSLGRTRHLVLGGQPVPVADAVGALLRAIADEGISRRNGEAPSALVLTHPVRWSAARCAELAAAATAVGLPEPVLVPEPVAAALHHGTDRIAVGDAVAVYDLGGGTFDTAVLRRTPDGYEVVGEPGGNPDLGGERLDDLLFGLVGGRLAQTAPDVWTALSEGTTPTARRQAAELRRDVRRAKEALSRQQSHTVHVSAAEQDVRLTRPEFEALVSAPLRDTVDELAATVERAGLTPSDLTAIHLVGGTSRIPLVTRLVAERFGELPSAVDDPKSVVALGAAQVLRGSAARAPEQVTAAPEPVAEATTLAPEKPPRRRRHLFWAVPVAAAALVAAVVGGATVLLGPQPASSQTVVPAADLFPVTPLPVLAVPRTTTPAPAPAAAPAPTRKKRTAEPAPRTTTEAAPPPTTTEQGCSHDCPTTEEQWSEEPTYEAPSGGEQSYDPYGYPSYGGTSGY